MDNVLWLQYLVFSPFLIGLGFWIYSRKYSHLPGNLGFPIFGNLYNIISSHVYSSPKDLLERLSNTWDQHGKVVCVWIGPIVAIAVADSVFIEEMSSNPAAANKESLVYDKLNIISIGPFTKSKSDSEWKQMRKTSNEGLMKHRLEAYHDIFVRRSMELVEALGEQRGEIDVYPMTQLSTADASIEAFFGFSFEILANRNYDVAKEISKLSHTMGVALANHNYLLISWCLFRYMNYRLTNLKKLFEKTGQILLENYKNNKYQEDELPSGVAAFKRNMENNIPFERNLLEAKETIFVSSYSVSTLINGLLVLLAAHPEIQEKVWEEQKNIFDTSNRMPSYEDLKYMEYLERVIKEGSRHMSAPFLARTVSEEATIGGYRIPKNSTIVIGSLKMRMDPNYWENPTKFDPDHFLPEKVLRRPKFINNSFGVLPRHCPGVLYTINASKVYLSAVIRNFELSTSLKAEELKYQPKIMMEFVTPYLIKCKRRGT